MKKITFIIFCLFISVIGYAQSESYITTNELWTGFTLKHKISKKTTLFLDQQTRVTDNLNSIRTNFFELGLKYKFSKQFNLKAQYRYTIRNSKRNVKRISLDANLKWKYKPAKITFKYRARFQNSTVVYTGQRFTFLRNRFGLAYPITKELESYVEYESFYRFNQRNEFRGNRFTIGLEYELNKSVALNGFYQIDKEINVKDPKKNNVIGVILKITI